MTTRVTSLTLAREQVDFMSSSHWESITLTCVLIATIKINYPLTPEHICWATRFYCDQRQMMGLILRDLSIGNGMILELYVE